MDNGTLEERVKKLELLVGLQQLLIDRLADAVGGHQKIFEALKTPAQPPIGGSVN